MYIDRPAGGSFGTHIRYRLYVNASHICITQDDTYRVAFERTPLKPGWYDAKHKRIVMALAGLELALMDAAGETEP